MSYSLLFLASTLIPAAPGDAMPDGKAAAPVTAAQAMPAPMPAEVAPAEVGPARPTFGQRLRNIFRPQRAERPEAPMLEPREGATLAPAAPAVVGASAADKTTTVTTLRPNFDLAEKDLKQVGHETDYSWITGKLFRAPGASGRYVLRYTAPYEEDRYGGEVLLRASPLLASCREGDLICVHGKVLGGAGARANPSYEVHSVDPIDRASH